MFYEIPVARPWTPSKEHLAYQNVLEQARLGDQVGFHSIWTVEHHFLEEFSHCSNPEVLYGAIAAQTENLRIGYGVRLLPAPYNHPVRSAESAAVLDLVSNGRVEFGTGRSATRTELEGFGVNPHETRAMWAEALEHIVGCWTNDEYSADCKEPVGRFINDRVATFTMVHTAETNEQAYEEAGDSMAWYPSHAGRLFGETARWMEGIGDGELGTYSYMEGAKELRAFEVPFEYIRDSGAAVVGDPARCLDLAKRYEAAGSGAGSRLTDRA
jgi:alkanesulfonate monooxygenase SsuD/methylene tetrahydromethanopterin reductase-like flavin-dependent oxidoreductase (luciferase family)